LSTPLHDERFTASPFTAERLEAYRQVRAIVDAHAAPGARVFVTGWRPELYAVLDHTPSSRCLAGKGFDHATMDADLARHPPAAIIVPSGQWLLVWSFEGGELRYSGLVLDALAVDPRFLDWLGRYRFRDLRDPRTPPSFQVLVPEAP